jgi:hypothetical protein
MKSPQLCQSGSDIGSRIWPRRATRRGRIGPEEIVDPAAGRCPAIQQWQGGKGIWTEVNCGPHSTLTAAGRRMTRSAKVARGRGHCGKRYDLDYVPPGSPEGRLSKIRNWKYPECNNGLWDQGIKQQPRGKIRVKDSGTRR